MKRKLVMIGVGAILVLTFAQLLYYFFNVFRPFDRFLGRDLQTPKGAPVLSELFTPILLNSHLIQWDESKVFYEKRLDVFRSMLGKTMQDKSNFVVLADASYAIGGTVSEIRQQKNSDGDISTFEFVLKNRSKETYTLNIDSVKIQNSQVFLRQISKNNFTRTKVVLEDIKTGDYLVIKWTTNLLNPEEEITEVEVMRQN